MSLTIKQAKFISLFCFLSFTNRLIAQNPAERLKEALSSQTSFQKNYLEMAEIAISTYKHIGRIRSARLIGNINAWISGYRYEASRRGSKRA